jgi:hypothetical protein
MKRTYHSRSVILHNLNNSRCAYYNRRSCGKDIMCRCISRIDHLTSKAKHPYNILHNLEDKMLRRSSIADEIMLSRLFTGRCIKHDREICKNIDKNCGCMSCYIMTPNDNYARYVTFSIITLLVMFYMYT